jgi:hypothetical protein
MSYDFDGSDDRFPPRTTIPTAPPDDLDAIKTLLELAAIYLTPRPNTQFTFEQLLAEARTIGGDEFVIEEKLAREALDQITFLERAGDLFYIT